MLEIFHFTLFPLLKLPSPTRAKHNKVPNASELRKKDTQKDTSELKQLIETLNDHNKLIEKKDLQAALQATAQLIGRRLISEGLAESNKEYSQIT